MFVTFLCAMFEPKSHRLTVANAGQCRPVLMPVGQSPRWAVKDLGTALGFEPGLEFPRTQLTMNDGDTLILYSDGVTEAFNPQDECYGADRLLADAGLLSGESATAITAGLLQKVHGFAGGAPQSDDIAVLTLMAAGGNVAVSPVPKLVRMELQATPEEVMRGVEALQQYAQAQGLPNEIIYQLALVFEECGSNIVNHSLQRDAGKKFHVVMEHASGDFTIEFRDPGPMFDPTTAPEHKLAADDDDLPGGWGIQLVRRYTDTITYTRAGRENVLRLAKRLGEPGGSQ
jgi:sigma-B regulation protein RsbU (phosphoserine phosphatase)